MSGRNTDVPSMVATALPVPVAAAEYRLTELGRSLLVPLSAVADWAVEHQAEIVAARSQ